MRSLLLLGSMLCSSVSAYTWRNVKIGGGGGFVPGIVFNPSAKGVAYARTDIGGLYRLNPDDSWTPLQDYVNDTQWGQWGVDALASDPVEPARVYVYTGMYTNSWDPRNASILRSDDYGNTWTQTPLPFKAGGNQPGRGMGERLAVDPQNNKIVYLGARSGNGLWKSVDQGVTWAKVDSFTAVGTYQADATDTSGYSNDINGLAAVTFDPTSALVNGATSRIFVGTADRNSSTWVSEDAGETWTAMAGQPIGVFPHKMKFSVAEKALYISYNSESGPYSAGTGSVYRVSSNGTFKDITPAWAAANSVDIGYGGLALDAQVPGTLMVTMMNLWTPDVQIFRSTDSGTTWSTIWDYDNGTTTPKKYYTYNTDKAPWISDQRQPDDTKVLGWMVEAIEIDPFDSDHWLYGTGLTVYGGHELTSWPNVAVSSLADGIEETAIKDIISPPGLNVELMSAVLDVAGFVHYDLDISPNTSFQDPFWTSTESLDYAGLTPKNILRKGSSAAQLATSSDAGLTWTAVTSVPATASGGSIAMAADASSIVWTSSAGSLLITGNASTTIASLPTGIAVVADKANASYFYAADSSGLYVSLDSGRTFNSAAKVTSYASQKLTVHPTIAGNLWLSTDQGIYHSTDFGVTFSQSAGVQRGQGIAVGKGVGNATNVYAFCADTTTGGPEDIALRVSADDGASWTEIQDAKHGFGSAGANVVAASWETEGLVMVGTNGRGIFYGMP